MPDIQTQKVIITGYEYWPPFGGDENSENCIRRWNDDGDLVTDVKKDGVWEEIDRKGV